MTKGTKQEAIALVKARFAQYHPFDLDDSTWRQVFDEHRTGDILEAVRRTATTRDKRPDKVFASLLFWVSKLERQRDEKERPIWPPPDVTPKIKIARSP